MAKVPLMKTEFNTFQQSRLSPVYPYYRQVWKWSKGWKGLFRQQFGLPFFPKWRFQYLLFLNLSTVLFLNSMKKSRKGDTLGPVELTVWPEQGNQGYWREQDD